VKTSNHQRIISPRVVIQLLIVIVAAPFLPLLISWRWSWWEAWAYAIISILGFVVSRVLAARRHPDVIAERAQHMQQENIKPWDKQLSVWLMLGGVAVLLVAGLDERFGWSPAFDLPVKLLALVMILAGYALSSYALIENRFFSSTVRIQTERGHHVVSSGPYRWVRHPGYAGGLLAYLAIPLLLDSPWAFLPTVFVTVLTIVRTALEDRTLQKELEGYREYAGRVRYRLLPGVW
jgi:protein-S-isoprenylcysteine O-methyltransferase Ste14